MNVLFVESDQTDRQLVEIQFEGRPDCTLVHAADTGEALKRLARQSFDAVVLSLTGGKPQFLRLHEAAPGLPMVILLQHEDPGLAAELIKAGAQDCLSKRHPLGEVLDRTLRYAIERSRIRRELDRRMTELTASEAMLRNIMDANSDAVLVIDGAGNVAFANSAAAAMFGMTAEALEGSPFGLPSSTGSDMEIDILRLDGSRGTAEMRLVEISWQGRPARLAALRDLTDRVKREEALQAAEARLRLEERHLAAAQRVAAVGSFEIELATLALRGSDEFYKMFGFADDTFADWESFLLSVMPPQEREVVAETVAAGRAGTAPPEIEFRFVRSDGAARRALQSAEILRDDAGRPKALLGVIRDVTELREAQARQREIEEQLRHVQRLEALGTLAGGIAHDLNNTLVPVRAIGTFLLTKIDPKHRQQIELIVRAGERATALVREVLTFSRKQPVEKEPVHLDILVKDIMTMLRAGVRSNIRLRTQLAEVPTILANSGQLYQIVLNLVTNAAQAIGSRSGEILVGVREHAQSGRPRGVCLFVRDNGDGMDDETRRRIFEPFFTTKSASDGTGLGLSVVQGIVAGHNATIDVRSAVGEGTIFEVVFPVDGGASNGKGEQDDE